VSDTSPDRGVRDTAEDVRSAGSDRPQRNSGLPPCCETDGEETAADTQSRYSSSRLSRDGVHDQHHIGTEQSIPNTAHSLEPLRQLSSSTWNLSGFSLAGPSHSTFFVLSFPVRAHIHLHQRSPTSQHLVELQITCSLYMPRKSGALSVKQAAGGISSDHKLPGARRRPFADITNMLDVQLRRHDGPSSPPSQPLTLSGMAMQNMGGSKSSDSAGARNYLAESVVPAFPPHAAPLPGSVPCLKGDSIRLKPSVSLGSGTLTQFPHELGFSDGPAGNDILPCGAPEVKFPLPCSGTSMREPLSTSLLPPKTHKLACGQLAILPSRSVLVDFREGERRKGRKGDEVMVVSPNGHLVIYSLRHQGIHSETSRFIFIVPLTSVLLVALQNLSSLTR
jgi:hypothetical protein